jgi:hypothetical protein
MHHVRKGDLWQYEERERLSRIGQEREESIAPSPYPSAWRMDYGGGVRRAGSLRVPKPGQRVERPKLGRMGSTESLRASEDVGHEESPAAVRLWGKWISNPRSGSTDPISVLLADDPPITSPISPTYASNSRSTLKVDISTPSPVDADTVDDAWELREPTGPAYSDGSPAMFFLDGQDRVDEKIWSMLRDMVLPNKDSRPTAEDLRAKWKELGMYDEEKS